MGTKLNSPDQRSGSRWYWLSHLRSGSHGPYLFEVSKEGFAKYVQSGIVLQIDTNPAIDAVLKVGTVNEQVIVQSHAALVGPDTS